MILHCECRPEPRGPWPLRSRRDTAIDVLIGLVCAALGAGVGFCLAGAWS